MSIGEKSKLAPGAVRRRRLATRPELNGDGTEAQRSGWYVIGMVRVSALVEPVTDHRMSQRGTLSSRLADPFQ